jgi:hypothetical protein
MYLTEFKISVSNLTIFDFPANSIFDSKHLKQKYLRTEISIIFFEFCHRLSTQFLCQQEQRENRTSKNVQIIISLSNVIEPESTFFTKIRSRN